jgi:hypothetical protein
VIQDSPEPSGQADDETAPEFPLSLKIIATSFQVVGIVAVVDIILAALSDRLSIDLGVLSLLIGRGLWRLSARARWWALFCLWWTLPLMFVVVILICSSEWDATEKIRSVSVFSLFCCFELWQLRVLLRREIREIFFAPEQKDRLLAGVKGRRYQFSLASLFVAMLVAGIVATRVGTLPYFSEHFESGGKPKRATGSGNRPLQEVVAASSELVADDNFDDLFFSTGGRTDKDHPGYFRLDVQRLASRDGARLISYSVGCLQPKDRRKKWILLYAVFASSDEEFDHPIQSTSSSRSGRRIRLSKLDGTKIELPESGRQLYEFSDGVYRESDQRVSMKQFVGFIRSDPEEYTIDGLLEFARVHPDKD